MDERRSIYAYIRDYFDQHLQRLKDVNTDLQNQLQRLLLSNGKTLGRILRKRGSEGYPMEEIDQTSSVTAGTFVFSIRLCDTPQLDICQNGWAGVNIPSDALVLASHFGFLYTVNKLLDLGHLADTLDVNGNGPLYVAVE